MAPSPAQGQEDVAAPAGAAVRRGSLHDLPADPRRPDAQNPTARVEYALRADEALSEPQVRQIMEYYLAVRVRRFARTYSSVGSNESGVGNNGSATTASGVYGRPSSMQAAVATPTVYRSTASAPRYGAPRPAVRPPARTPGRP
jgi:hypothetical protein